MSRRNKNKQPAAVWLYRHTIKSAAWQALSVGARATYIELAANYNTNMKNAVYLSIRTGAEKLGVDKKAVIKWLHELQHYGFIVVVQRGTIGVYGYGRASQFRLTDRPYVNSPPTHDFQNWTGEVFEPPKFFPGPKKGPHRSEKGTIRKFCRAGSLWSEKGTIEAPADRSEKGTITSVASYQASKTDAVGLSTDAEPTSFAALLEPVAMSGLKVWTTPVLTEIPYTDELRRLYRNAAPTDDGLDIPEFLRRV